VIKNYFNSNKFNLIVFALIGLILMVLFLLVFVHSYSRPNVPPELIGRWETKKNQITVRTENKKSNFQFTSDSAICHLEIKNNTASGSVGKAEFQNAVIKKMGSNPLGSGNWHKIKCGSIGEIFENDPLNVKEVQIWVYPVNEDTIDTELRYTEGWAIFPMAIMIFTKVSN
jgi:hypothetical protein